MTTDDRFVPFRITVCGLEELPGHCEVGVSHVLSLLDPGWPDPDAFGDYGEHERLALRFHDIVEERAGLLAPEPEHVAALLGFGRDLLREQARSAHVLVHCHMGVSRSTAAMTLLVAQARPDRPAREALAAVVRARPIAWPNLRIVELGDGMLGRKGELVAAVREHYRAVVADDPARGRMMRDHGRAREVEGIEIPA